MLSDWQEAWLCRTACGVCDVSSLPVGEEREKTQLMISFYRSCGNVSHGIEPF